MSRVLPLPLLLAMLLHAACQSPPDTVPSHEHISEQPYDGPPVTLNVLVQRYVQPVEYVAVIEIMAPTGGWEAVLDHAEISDDDDDEPGASFFVTLQGPADDELTTQALVPHHLTHRSDVAFETARVYVRRHHRGQSAGDYRLAAQQ